MYTLFLPLCIVVAATMFYAKSAWLRGNLQGARLATLVCIVVSSGVVAMSVAYFINSRNASDMVLAVLWAGIAYMEMKKLDSYKQPPPGSGEGQNQGQ